MTRGSAELQSCCCVLAVLAMYLPAFGQEETEGLAENVIHYHASAGLTDPIARLQTQLASGKTQLQFERERGYLTALLRVLNVPVASQTLVFSKTSSQAEWTSPKTPRALYFSDNVYVGWAPDAKEIDLAAVDPQRGPVFYTLAQSSNGPPVFSRRDDCLRCHLSPRTVNVPGLLVRSVYTAPDGTPLGQVTGFVSGHNSPLSERWGGWYVTGTHSGTLHRGNVFATNPGHPEQMELAVGANILSLQDRFDTSRYLSSDSDIVALLVLEHQIRMQNLITHADYEARCALQVNSAIPAALPVSDPTRPYSQSPSSYGRERMAKAGELLLEYMLFRNEAPLPGPVKGTSSFTADFQRAGPHTLDGRSLRQLDLHTRLFRYPCSFLVYSPAFDALPQPMKQYLWQRLNAILSGQDHSQKYATLSAGDRGAVLEILRQTKPEFAAWHPR